MADNLLKIWPKLLEEDRAWHGRGYTGSLLERWLILSKGIKHAPFMSRSEFIQLMKDAGANSPSDHNQWARALLKIVKDAD